ncbi:DNA polymerase III subunit epsilon [Bifidobacterium sp. CP2]|uniref:3'-5' exonuclease n=1 Tax=Bifidobacterium sp. CP2 TaxID=2809025 RepID=UPI001BDBDAF1|nr:DNA polymerase III subunit epsilon [Bifidobacterium sp. CP2]MBT1181072.1 DNA polymerase III subunit epsilon [Bifidobacterium sp. CP2]
MTNTNPASGRAWLTQAKEDIAQWEPVMPRDADGKPIDWRWIRELDLEHGIGAGRRLRVPEPEEEPADDAIAEKTFAHALHDALAADYVTRERLEAVIAQCSTAFMTDFDRRIASYRLPRALAWANRRLNDDIAWLIRLGERHHLWNATHRQQGRASVVTLTPAEGARTAGIRLDDLADRTGTILETRAARRNAERRTRRESDALVARANLSGATAPGGEPADLSIDVRGRAHDAATSDWRDVYLPGRDVDTVMGIDIETTGIDPARVYIIDIGFEYMNMISQRPAEAPADYAYEQSDYRAGDAYGQSRLGFGVPDMNARLGNPFIAKLTGIDVRERAASDGHRPFDEWPAAQAGLLKRLERQPYVAHNATFEHGFFMLTIEGYAERYRDGRITIIDTLPMSRRWDPGAAPSEHHLYGDNTLDAYAKRQGALAPDRSERHLGLEDAHIMLVAMKHHLAALRAERQGPWGSGGRGGTGGKRCGRGA